MKKQVNNLVSLALLWSLIACESDTSHKITAKRGAISSVDDDGLRGSAADFIANAGDRVFFDFDRSNISSDANATLRRQGDWLRKNSGLNVQIEGHCDERGTREYNIALGHRRAEAAGSRLKNCGVPSSRINTISYGKDRPIAVQGNQSEVYRMNRVAISVLDKVS
ncbi:MAG: OmpA family protein [Holosporaceae bacterium]|jgi:peptidoglycan-associated lipoprotein|nr:OmpA family protein [Holosporaceae bacterium]